MNLHHLTGLLYIVASFQPTIILGICILHRICLAYVKLEGPVQHAMDTEDELEGSCSAVSALHD